MFLELYCKAKIADFNTKLLIDESVANFQISVNHSFVLHEPDPFNKLFHEIARLYFAQCSPSVDQVEKRLVRAQIYDQVNVLDIFEKVDQAYQTLMVHGFLDTDLTLQFILSIIDLPLTSRVFRFKVSF